jgi:hypothetical protein
VGSFVGTQIDKFSTAGANSYENVSGGVGNLLSGGGEAIAGVGEGIDNALPYLGLGAAALAVMALAR